MQPQALFSEQELLVLHRPRFPPSVTFFRSQTLNFTYNILLNPGPICKAFSEVPSGLTEGRYTSIEDLPCNIQRG